MSLEHRAWIEALADSLTECADAYRDRLQLGIRQGELDQDHARVCFDDEMLLRERASGLYADAASLIIQEIDAGHSELIRLLKQASERLRAVQRVVDIGSLIGDLLTLATGVAAANPGSVIVALGQIRSQLADLSTTNQSA